MQLSLPAENTFQNEPIPAGTHLAGAAALVAAYNVQAPVRKPACVSEQNIKGHIREQQGWRIYSKRYALDDSVAAHINFAMKYEDFDLLVLKRVFEAIEPQIMEQYVGEAPTSIFTRRAWFLYELLTGKILSLPDAPNVTAVDILDPERYFAKPNGSLSRRHKVRDNLLGDASFCPIIRRTESLEAFVSKDLAQAALKAIGRVSKAVTARAASFLLLADSQASFQIEGEQPPRNRIERWGRAVMQAGKHPLSVQELVRLHQILIEDNRFVKPELRKEGVFLGERTVYGDPLPEFIGARPEDLSSLLDGMVKANSRMREAGIDPVLQATATAFGFVYIHPFEDGNGRLHRCLIHHSLTERHFSPPGMLFPVSSVMLDWIDMYRKTLQNHSAPLMEFIDWSPTEKGNVEVNNDTADLYRYFDCTEAAEFLYRCVERTIDVDLPREIEYLTRRDEALHEVMNIVEMPDRLAEQFILYVLRNSGTLPNRRRKEFAALTEDELARLEAVVRTAFDGFAGEHPSES